MRLIKTQKVFWCLIYFGLTGLIREGGVVKPTPDSDFFSKTTLKQSVPPIFHFDKNKKSGEITLEGKVTNKAGNPIAYVNIGIPEKGIGGITNKNGKFEIAIPESHLTDTLKFSAIGYHSKKFVVNQVTGKDHIILQEKVYQSEAVTIKGKKADYQTEKLGDWKPLIGYNYRCYSSEGCKMVTRLDMEVDSAYVKKVRVWIGKNEDTSVRARAWVYNIKNGRPGKPLVKESVIQKVPEGKSWLVFDMSRQKIKVHSDFFVGIEFLSGNKTNKYDSYVGSRLNGEPGKSWQMYHPQGSWKAFGDEFVMQAIIQHN